MLLLYRVRVLVSFVLPDAAVEVLTLAARRRKDRPDELLRQVRYDPASPFEGRHRQAQPHASGSRLVPDFGANRLPRRISTTATGRRLFPLVFQ